MARTGTINGEEGRTQQCKGFGTLRKSVGGVSRMQKENEEILDEGVVVVEEAV